MPFVAAQQTSDLSGFIASDDEEGEEEEEGEGSGDEESEELERATKLMKAKEDEVSLPFHDEHNSL